MSIDHIFDRYESSLLREIWLRANPSFPSEKTAMPLLLSDFISGSTMRALSNETGLRQSVISKLYARMVTLWPLQKYLDNGFDFIEIILKAEVRDIWQQNHKELFFEMDLFFTQFCMPKIKEVVVDMIPQKAFINGRKIMKEVWTAFWERTPPPKEIDDIAEPCSFTDFHNHFQEFFSKHMCCFRRVYVINHKKLERVTQEFWEKEIKGLRQTAITFTLEDDKKTPTYSISSMDETEFLKLKDAKWYEIFGKMVPGMLFKVIFVVGKRRKKKKKKRKAD